MTEAAKKLLVADDSLTIQKVIRLALSNEGYEIQTVSDGDDAIQQISLFRPDVVLIDVSLPGQSAFDVKRAVNSADELQDVKFILMSSAFEKIDESQMTELVFHGRLTKPFDPAHLRQVIADVTERGPSPTLATASSPSAPAPAVAQAGPPPPPLPGKVPTPPPFPQRPAARGGSVAVPPSLTPPPPPPGLAQTSSAAAASATPIISPPPPLPPAPSFANNDFAFEEETQELDTPNDLDSFLRPLTPDDGALDEPIPPPPPLTASAAGQDQGVIEPSTNPWESDENTETVITPPPLIVPAPGPTAAPEPMPELTGDPDSDIRHLTESTIRMSGLDDFEWSVQEPSIKPGPGFSDDGGTSFRMGDDEAESTPPPLPSRIAPAPATAVPVSPNPSPGGSVSGLSAAQVEELIKRQVEEALTKMAQQILPEVAERIIKQEIHKMLSEQP